MISIKQQKNDLAATSFPGLFSAEEKSPGNEVDLAAIYAYDL